MELQTIERAANDFINDFCYDHIDSSAINHEEDNYEAGRNHSLLDYGNDIFIAGAQWRINSVWHDASDKPERNRDFLYESTRGWFGINNITKMAREVYPEKWDRFVEGYDVIRWAYIDDLLPERKEKLNEKEN